MIGNVMDRIKIANIQNFLRKTLGSKNIKIEGRVNKSDSAEVTINDEFIGIISEDDEDNEICYHFNMTILNEDLQE